jgi:hypothetical protein
MSGATSYQAFMLQGATGAKWSVRNVDIKHIGSSGWTMFDAGPSASTMTFQNVNLYGTVNAVWTVGASNSKTGLSYSAPSSPYVPVSSVGIGYKTPGYSDGTAPVPTPTPATGACVVPSTNYGVATLKMNVNAAGEYRMWTRMFASDITSDSVLMDIDGKNCYTVGDGQVKAKEWTWVGHQNGNVNSVITATLSSGAHTIKLIGREASVKIDRILAVADQNCSPSILGDNCMEPTDTVKPAVNITAPADSSEVSGATLIAANASDNKSVVKVEFYVQGQLMATDTTKPYEYKWETSSSPNGATEISAKAYDTVGNSGSSLVGVVVKNGDVEPPLMPTNLKASAVSYNKVNLSWNASTDADTYRVVRV